MHPVSYQEPSVTHLLERAAGVDGHPPFSAHKIESIGGHRTRTGAWSDGTVLCVVGVAAPHELSGHWAVEVAVAPECRDPRVEDAAIRAATSLPPSTAMHTVWAFRTDQIEAVLRLGYTEIRSVLRLAGPIPEEGNVSVSRVVVDLMAPGDAGGIVAVNNLAFADHREQGAMTEESLGSLVARSGFDPAGVLVVREEGRVVGFCITKREGDAMGEIFVIGVNPEKQRSGIGRALIRSSLEALRGRGARNVSLWVDATNTTALRFYATLGLTEDFRTREFALSLHGAN